MDFFAYKNGELYCEEIPAEKIAREVGTPAYVYSKATFLHHYRQIAESVGRAIRDELLFRAEVRSVAPGSLPRYEMKARRVVNT